MADSVATVRAGLPHLQELSHRACRRDLAECRDMFREPLLSVICRQYLEAAQSYAILVNDEVHCVYGFSEHVDSEYGELTVCPWSVVSEEFLRRKRLVWKTGVFWTKLLRSRYNHIAGFVDSRHEDRVRFLRRLGFDLQAPAALSSFASLAPEYLVFTWDKEPVL